MKLGEEKRQIIASVVELSGYFGYFLPLDSSKNDEKYSILLLSRIRGFWGFCHTNEFYITQLYEEMQSNCRLTGEKKSLLDLELMTKKNKKTQKLRKSILNSNIGEPRRKRKEWKYFKWINIINLDTRTLWIFFVCKKGDVDNLKIPQRNHFSISYDFELFSNIYFQKSRYRQQNQLIIIIIDSKFSIPDDEFFQSSSASKFHLNLHTFHLNKYFSLPLSAIHSSSPLENINRSELWVLRVNCEWEKRVIQSFNCLFTQWSIENKLKTMIF